MTKARKLYEALLASDASHVSPNMRPTEIYYLGFNDRMCSLCKEKNLPTNYLFAIFSTTGLIKPASKEFMVLLPLCTENLCISHKLLPKASFDGLLYFMSVENKKMWEIPIDAAITIIKKIFKYPYIGDSPIKFTDGFVISDIEQAHQMIIPVVSGISETKKTPEDYDYSYTRHHKYPKDWNRVKVTDVSKKKEVTKQFKLYVELSHGGTHEQET